jgi:hypothetical protein
MRRNADLQEFNFALEFADYLSYLDANITKEKQKQKKNKNSFEKTFPSVQWVIQKLKCELL